MPKAPDHKKVEEVWLPVQPDDKGTPDELDRPAVPRRMDTYGQWADQTKLNPLYFGHQLTSWLDWMRSWLKLDPEAKPALLVATFAAGIIAYFHLPREPILAVLVAAFALLVCLAWRARSGRAGAAGRVAVAGALLLAGAIAAQIQVNRVDTPMLAEEVTVRIAGTVLFAQRRADGRQRVDLLIDHIERAQRHTVPERVRLTLRQSELLTVGSYVEGRVRLMPHTGPAYPGGYDFGFAHFFERRGALGFSMGDLKAVESAVQPQLSWMQQARLAQSHARSWLAARIRSSLPGEAGHVAVALITGERQAISAETNESLRASGLAHILAISGLHMTLIVGSVFFGLRFLISLHPRWSLHFPVKKLAAASALAFATAYLAISGGGLATQRAYITLAVMLMALLLDRRAISLRNVAVAAAIVLLMQPHAIFLAGFQMSFAAVASLVACYRTWGRLRDYANALRDSDLPLKGRRLYIMRWFSTSPQYFDKKWYSQLSYGLVRFFVGIATTSLIAGLATGLFAAWHFHRVAPMGLFANLLAMPFVSLSVMPGLLASMLALPFGLDPPVLKYAGWGIDMVRDIAAWTADLGPAGRVGPLPPSIFVLGLSTLAIIVGLRGLAKLLAMPLVALMGALWSLQIVGTESPEALISSDGKLVATRSIEGNYTFNSIRAQSFTRGIWLRAFAPSADPNTAQIDLMPCDEHGCYAQTHSGITLAWARTPEALREDCSTADIIVTALAPPAL
ncbi:MAG: ComEC/Rec2 family competence protein, partial [Pseudomonadota bacterium]